MVTESNFQEETGFLRNLCKSRGFSGTQPGFLVMVDLVCPFFLAVGPDTWLNSLGVSVRIFVMRLTSEFVDWVKQIVFTIVSGPHSIH